MSPRISVVVPVRNGAEFIADTLARLVRQTYASFHVVVLENCSTDGTPEIVRSFDDERISVVPAERPLTIEENWARILDLDLSEYLCILCHDDPPDEGYLEEIARLIIAEPNATLYHTRMRRIAAGGLRVRRAAHAPYRETGTQYLRNFHRGREDSNGSGYAMRSADFRAVGGLPRLPNLLFADIVCWYRLTSLSYKVCSPLALFSVRVHPGSMGRTTRVLEFLDAGRRYVETLEALGVQQEDLRAAERFVGRFLRSEYAIFLRDIVRSRDPERIKRLHELDAALAREGLRGTAFQVPRRRVAHRIAQIHDACLRNAVFAGPRAVRRVRRELERGLTRTIGIEPRVLRS